MRLLLLSLIVLGFSFAAGCECNSQPSTFWWNSRLVPITDHERVVSGTGLTLREGVVPETRPAMQ
jgi:hypothetical protein